MALTVYWTRFAENKLGDIYAYYSQTANKRIASRLVDGIIARSLELENNPLIGPKEIALSGRLQEFRYLVYKNYKLIYWVNIIRKESKFLTCLTVDRIQKKLMRFKTASFQHDDNPNCRVS
jgi:plasmid stabilization system protein ParE